MPALGAGGREFESRYPDKKEESMLLYFCAVIQTSQRSVGKIYLIRTKPIPNRCTAALSKSSRTDGSAILINALARSANGRLRR